MTDQIAYPVHHDQEHVPFRNWDKSAHKNADLQITSSDDELFWVSSDMLARHSSVFKSMLSISNDDPSNAVQLTDPDIEIGGSTTLEVALSILVDIDDGDPDSLYSDLEWSVDPSVVRCAQKYEMKIMIAAIKAFLFDSVTQYPPTGWQHILVAAVLGEWALCGRLIATLTHDMHNERDEVKEMRRMMDWRGWRQDDLDALTQVGPKFVWAVCRAGMKHAGAKMDQRINYEAMGEDVAKLMMMDVIEAETWADIWVRKEFWDYDNDSSGFE